MFMKFFLFLITHLAALQPVLVVVGTRPEAIKMIPLYRALKEEQVPVLLCSTGQHSEILDSMFEIFQVTPDFKFNIMKPGQDLFYITEEVLVRMKALCQQVRPSLVLVHGDTTTAMAAALAAFYLQIPVGHVEAGLRSGNRHSPFPEELNRRMITLVATHHFAPTQQAVDQLISEGIESRSIHCTGNTVVDALLDMKAMLEDGSIHPTPELSQFFESHKKVLLLTAHRRESVPHGLKHIFAAIRRALERDPDLAVIYPVHPNPAIQERLLHSVPLRRADERDSSGLDRR